MAVSLKRMDRPKRGLRRLVILLVLALIVVAGFLAVKFLEMEPPVINLSIQNRLLGRQSSLPLRITDKKSGVRDFVILLRQGKHDIVLMHRQFVRKGGLTGGPPTVAETVKIDAAALGLSDGRADLLIKAHDFSYWHWGQGNETTVSYPLIFDTKAPKLSFVDGPRLIKPGSAGIIIYRANEELGKSGLNINGYYFPGFPVKARGRGIYGALIGLPYNTEKIKTAFISAVDRAGNEGRLNIGLEVRKTIKHRDRINISESFLKLKMPQFAQNYPEMKGTLLEEFLYVNNNIRHRNAAKIREICLHTSPQRFWKGRFERMRRSSRRAGFADYRTYYYKGRVIDHQVHKGLDLASIRHARIQAANAGQVVYADYLGIYGNVVILDHGQGLFSLYAHLSQIKVAVGDMVKKGGLLGRSGHTGMAGGDHLHFSILVDGVFVNPVEWWDKNWVRLNVEQYLR
ncbi:MAG TPA: M23 family metallopeptidase [Desulfobacterales bacterium]|nr:M23 family metallopeptidase [Desulfobacterales bacterium]